MNTNYYEKIKMFLFCSTTKKYFPHHKCGVARARESTHKMRRAKKVNSILNCGTGQPNSHFACLNLGQTKMSRTAHFIIPTID